MRGAVLVLGFVFVFFPFSFSFSALVGSVFIPVGGNLVAPAKGKGRETPTPPEAFSSPAFFLGFLVDSGLGGDTRVEEEEGALILILADANSDVGPFVVSPVFTFSLLAAGVAFAFLTIASPFISLTTSSVPTGTFFFLFFFGSSLLSSSSPARFFRFPFEVSEREASDGPTAFRLAESLGSSSSWLSSSTPISICCSATRPSHRPPGPDPSWQLQIGRLALSLVLIMRLWILPHRSSSSSSSPPSSVRFLRFIGARRLIISGRAVWTFWRSLTGAMPVVPILTEVHVPALRWRYVEETADSRWAFRSVCSRLTGIGCLLKTMYVR